MNYEAFASDLPPERTFTFRSAEENEETMLRMGVNQEMRQLRRGPFRSDLAVRATQTAELFADRFSTACRMYLEPPPGMVGLPNWRRSLSVSTIATQSTSRTSAAKPGLAYVTCNAPFGHISI